MDGAIPTMEVKAGTMESTLEPVMEQQYMQLQLELRIQDTTVQEAIIL